MVIDELRATSYEPPTTTTETSRYHSCMRLLFGLLIAIGLAFAADWNTVQRLAADQKIEVVTRDGIESRALFISASPDSLIVHDNSGERSIARTDIRRVRVYDAGRRVRKGLMWTLIGAGTGAGIGAAACPYCPNEGNTSPFIGPGAAAGAGLGALGFLSSPYRTIYKSK